MPATRSGRLRAICSVSGWLTTMTPRRRGIYTAAPRHHDTTIPCHHINTRRYSMPTFRVTSGALTLDSVGSNYPSNELPGSQPGIDQFLCLEVLRRLGARCRSNRRRCGRRFRGATRLRRLSTTRCRLRLGRFVRALGVRRTSTRGYRSLRCVLAHRYRHRRGILAAARCRVVSGPTIHCRARRSGCCAIAHRWAGVMFQVDPSLGPGMPLPPTPAPKG